MTAVAASSGVTLPILPVAPIQLNGQVLQDARIRSIQVNQSVGRHDSAVINLTMPLMDSDALLGQSVYLRWGTNPNYGYFYGYVSAIDKPQNFQASIPVNITCLGWSSKMRAGEQRMFSGKTSAQIVRELTIPYRFGVKEGGHTFTHERLAQTGTTDWETAVGVAGMGGDVIVPFGGVVAMVDPFEELERGAAFNVYKKSVQVLDSNRSLLSFTPSTEVHTVKKELAPEYAYFSTDGTVQVHTPDVAPDQRNFVSKYIYSAAHGEMITAGHKLKSGLDKSATARLRGDASIRPGMCIGIDTGVSQAAQDSNDGLWFVLGVAHIINEAVFQTEVKLVRDKTRQLKSNPYVHFYDNTGQRMPFMTLEGTNWVSSWRQG